MMAQRRTSKAKQRPEYTCKDCRNAYDWQCKGATGKPFLCRCPHFHYLKFLNIDYCDNFIHR